MLSDAVSAVQALQPVVYILVAVATLVRWVRRRDRASGLASALFLLLAAVLLVSGAQPDEGGSLLAQQLVIAVLVCFPYVLFRFAAVFRRPQAWLEVLAGGVTLVAVGAIFLFRDIPGPDDRTPAAFAAYTALVIAQWVGLSALVAWWFWTAGRGRPTVVRRRMRTLAAGAMTLASALLLAGLFADADLVAVELAVAVLAVVAAPLFLAGLAPPRVLLDQWRRRDEDALWDVEARLVAAGSADDVAEALLPFVVQAVGGRAAVLGDRAGTVVAAHGVAPDQAAGLLATSTSDHQDESVISADLHSGRLLVVGDRFTPFFGHEEVETVARLGRLTDVAMRRAAADVAEQRATEELRRAHAAMRDFVAAASHDLRTPIAVIKGFAATMTGAWESIPDEAKLKHLATIDRQAGHLSRIVTDLLTVSQLDSGAVEPDLVDVDLGAVVREVIEDLDHDGGTATLEAAPDGTLVRADAEHVRRIVRNLLENAVNYGEPPVTVDLRVAPPSVELRVRDRGEGVPETFVPYLFDRFARADRAASKAKHGTGLGLSIVRGLARAGGGEAWYEANDPGACFVVRFPMTGRGGTS